MREKISKNHFQFHKIIQNPRAVVPKLNIYHKRKLSKTSTKNLFKKIYILLNMYVLNVTTYLTQITNTNTKRKTLYIHTTMNMIITIIKYDD